MTNFTLRALLPLLLLLAPLQSRSETTLYIDQQIKILSNLEECGLPKADAANAASVFTRKNTMDGAAKLYNETLSRRMARYSPAGAPDSTCDDLLMSAGNAVHAVAFINAFNANNVGLIPYRLYSSDVKTQANFLNEVLDPMGDVHACVADPVRAAELTEPYYMQAKMYLARAQGKPYAKRDFVDSMFKDLHPDLEKSPWSSACASKLFEAGARGYLLTVFMDEDRSEARSKTLKRYMSGAKR